ncbi:MerR family transcriptional regulator [Conexibacter sp. S30A1]|uniref:MerR family transcriptional regulator n=1 Tax=Conexibacter sp. S30A1 TaxID=2937800 RepID=UPI00201079C7|nr:MerR family transcriptional regulator [Conexibacter sp. S30A1]
MQALRIGEFARRVGVPASSLRAWEQRYGLLDPARSAGGFRLYGESDAQRVAVMLRGLKQGLSAAEAAAAALKTAPVGTVRTQTGDLPRARQQLIEAFNTYDEGTVHAVIDAVLAAYGLETCLTELVLPALTAVGSGWERGEPSIGQEHFASNLIRARLLALARLWGRGGGPLALLACVPREQHDISLIAFGLVLRTYGWRIVFLGTDTPISTVAQAVAVTGPTVCVLSAFAPALFEQQGPALRRLAREAPVLLSGPGADAEIAQRLHLPRLGGDLVTAARELDESFGPRPRAA